MGVSPRTVQRDLQAASPIPPRRRKASRFDAYAPYVLRRWQAGCRNGLQLWREIQAQGYPDSPKMVHAFLRVLRTTSESLVLPPPSDTDPPAVVLPPPPPPAGPLDDLTTRRAVWVLVRDPASLDAEEQALLQLLRQRSATVGQAYQLIQAFMELLHTRRGDQLAGWMQAVQAQAIPALLAFVTGLERDYAAVVAGVTREENNGVVEGQVDRLKLVKRQMFGRAGFALLRQRMCADPGHAAPRAAQTVASA